MLSGRNQSFGIFVERHISRAVNNPMIVSFDCPPRTVASRETAHMVAQKAAQKTAQGSPRGPQEQRPAGIGVSAMVLLFSAVLRDASRTRACCLLGDERSGQGIRRRECSAFEAIYAAAMENYLG